MKKVLVVLCVIVLIFSFSGTSNAVSFYVDSAPNVYGSPDWGPWWTDTKADVAAGTFVNMRTGTYPGTTGIDPYDEIVYSTMDLGKRLHWIYWLPGETVAGIDGLFEVKWAIDWGGDNWTYDAGAWAVDGPEVGWSQPLSWEDYGGGVIGSLGFAWWSTDNDAPPMDTGGSSYNEVDQADIDALRDLVFENQTFALGQVRHRANVDADWEYESLQVNVVPEPATMLLLGSGLIGLAGFRRKNKRLI